MNKPIRSCFQVLAILLLYVISPANALCVWGYGSCAPNSMLDAETLQSITQDKLELRGFKRDPKDRPLCQIKDQAGNSCTMEAWAFGERTKDADGFKCVKVDLSVVYSGCVNGFVHGLVHMKVAGTQKDTTEAIIGLFVKGRAMYPLVQTFSNNDATKIFLGLRELNSSYGCFNLPEWDNRNRLIGCRTAARVFGDYLMSPDGALGLKTGNGFDAGQVARDFMKWWR